MIARGTSGSPPAGFAGSVAAGVGAGFSAGFSSVPGAGFVAGASASLVSPLDFFATPPSACATNGPCPTHASGLLHGTSPGFFTVLAAGRRNFFNGTASGFSPAKMEAVSARTAIVVGAKMKRASIVVFLRMPTSAGNKLRIAQIAPLRTPIPPSTYGGVDLLLAHNRGLIAPSQ